jgi:TRAP transporter TAXI family solute receptor
MKKLTVAFTLVVAALGLNLTVQPAVAAGKLTTVPVLLCPHGCGPVAGDTILMNQMIKADMPVELLPQETPGYMYNIRKMLDESLWKTTAFSTEDFIIQLAYNWGGTPELKEFLPVKVPVRFKLLYGEAWWTQGRFFVTFDPKIKSIADLKGKRVDLGLRSQSDWGTSAYLLLKYGYGISSENTTIRFMTPGALTQQLIDGAADATVTAFGMEPTRSNWLIPAPLRQLEASGKPLRYLGVDKAVIDKVNKKFGMSWLYETIPAGTLPGQKEAFGVAAVRCYKAVAPGFPEDVSYQLVMEVAKLGPEMKKLNALWSIWSPDLMVAGLSDENVDPGANRAYQELGWWDLTKKYEKVPLPQ